MNITYTGKLGDLSPDQGKKLQEHYDKLSKMVGDQGGDKNAHVMLDQEDRGHDAEITVNYRGQSFTAHGVGTDQYAALTNALQRLERQIQRLRDRKRDTARESAYKVKVITPLPAPEAVGTVTTMTGVDTGNGTTGGQQRGGAQNGDNQRDGRVYVVTDHDERKPMSMEEALAVIDDVLPYFSYRDAQSNRVCVLIRREDGDFDLIEG